MQSQIEPLELSLHHCSNLQASCQCGWARPQRSELCLLGDLHWIAILATSVPR
jgi:hypothetical protein